MIRHAPILALAILFCLASCGQKGPLRLPEPAVAEVEPQPDQQIEEAQE